MPKKHLILVDDDELVLETVAEGLTLAGYDCLTFPNPLEAINQCKWLPPDLMIVDFEMPELTGLELIKTLKKELQEECPPLLVVSGISDEKNIAGVLKAGARDFLSKPVSLALLRTKIKNILAINEKTRTFPVKEREPQLIGQYVIESELGRGGMGVVYLAKHRVSGKKVAVKTMIANSKNIDALLRFRREIDLLVSLGHPNLTKIYDAGRSKDVFYYAMEFIPGLSLEQLIIQRGPVSAEEVTRICYQVCGGLEHIHKLNLVHRDIKPANIMISSTKGAILTDFGLSKSKCDNQLTATNQLVGTPHFMSPEYILGGDQTESSDLFALGLVCIEALLGEHVYETDNAYTIMQAIVNGDFPGPEDIEEHLGKKLPKALKATLRRMTLIDPKYRFASAAEVRQSLTAMT